MLACQEYTGNALLSLSRLLFGGTISNSDISVAASAIVQATLIGYCYPEANICGGFIDKQGQDVAIETFCSAV